jgi:hypothetical protein
MSGQQIACLWVPYLGARVARRAEQELGEGPLILIDEGGRVLAADARAAARGVAPGMGERQAVVRCPEARSAPAARYPIWEAQDALWEEVKRYAWRWQPAGLGCIYLETEERQASPSRQAAGSSGLLDRSPLPFYLLDWCQALAGAVRQLGWAASSGQMWPGRSPGRTQRFWWLRKPSGLFWPDSR